MKNFSTKTTWLTAGVLFLVAAIVSVAFTDNAGIGGLFAILGVVFVIFAFTLTAPGSP